MPCVTDLLCAHRVPCVAALALISLACAGCSADRSTRLSETDLSNPFASQPEATVPPAVVPPAALAPQVERRELPEYAGPQSPY
jgi:hypothetical protein